MTEEVKEEAKTLGFKLDRQARERLDIEAAKTGRSAGEYSRDVVMASLDAPKGEDTILAKISALEKSFADVRLKLSNAMEMVMVLSEKATREQAKEWVNQYMRK